ncbi:MAG: SRPBCC domain-containing protein [Anaerolineae bacterium]
MAERELFIKQTIDASQDLVYRAFTDCSLLAEWWGPREFTNPRCEVDARPGGEIRIDMRGPDGIVYPMKGRFLEVSAPDRIVFTSSAFEDENGVPGLEDHNIITLEGDANRTILTLQARVTKSTPQTADALAGMEIGWRESLERLNTTLQSCEEPLKSEAMLIAEPGSKEAVTTARIKAERERVFEALTDPSLIPQWWGPARYKTVVEHMDVRPGGSWRFVQYDSDGREEAFRGEYRQVAFPEKLVYSFEYEGMPGHIAIETISLKEVDGQTRITDSLQFDSVEDRDGMVQSGMESGEIESYDRLANLYRECHLHESAAM